MIVGADLRRAREGQQVSLARLARLIRRDKGHLSRVETGSGREVTPALVRDLARLSDARRRRCRPGLLRRRRGDGMSMR
ncbi:MAG: helix-turn-helix domain-containing protein [Dermatophilaceae bacterium]